MKLFWNTLFERSLTSREQRRATLNSKAQARRFLLEIHAHTFQVSFIFEEAFTHWRRVMLLLKIIATTLQRLLGFKKQTQLNSKGFINTMIARTVNHSKEAQRGSSMEYFQRKFGKKCAFFINQKRLSCLTLRYCQCNPQKTETLRFTSEPHLNTKARLNL